MPLLTLDARPTWIRNCQRLFGRIKRKIVGDDSGGMMFPVEIIEQILLKCDGPTLLNCRDVNYVFRKSVDYLMQKYPMWKWCCHEEIPQNELIDILQKYDDLSDPDLWHNIYMNWTAWKNIKNNINFDIVPTATEIPRITCIAASDGYIAVGSEDGRIRLYNDNWDCIYTERHFSVKVTGISFIFDEERPFGADRPIFLVIAYNNLLVLEECQGWTAEPLILRDIKAHSVYKRFICYEKLGGRMTVTQLSIDRRGARLFEITFARIYSPSEVSCLRMWKGVCTFLINSEVKVLKYDPFIQPVHNVHNKTHIKFSWKDLSSDAMNCQIFRDDIIIGLPINGKSMHNQFLELFILGSNNNEYSKKLFNSWEILHAYITCTYLYGNTFIVGVDIGNVYFYHVSSWKTFDLRNYQHKETLGKHPIIGIDVRETARERRFYVTSNVAAHEIIGMALPDYICKLKPKEDGAKV